MVWPNKAVARGRELIQKLGIPDADVVTFGMCVCVAESWKDDIQAFLVGEGNAQLPYKNWFERAPLVRSYVISVDPLLPPKIGYIVGDGPAYLSTMERFYAEEDETSTDSWSGVSERGYLSVDVWRTAEFYHPGTTYLNAKLDTLTLSIPVRKLGSVPHGDYLTQSPRFWNSAEAMASLGTSKWGVPSIGGDSAFVERRSALAVVNNSILRSSVATRRYVMIEGPAVVTRGEYHPSYEWYVATTHDVAARMENLRRYVTDPNELARIDKQIALMAARGEDLIGVGRFGPDVNPYTLHPTARKHAQELILSNDSSGSPSLVQMNRWIRSTAGSWFSFAVNLADPYDDVDLLIPGATAVTIEVSDHLKAVPTGGTVAIDQDDETVLLIATLAHQKGLPVTIVRKTGSLDSLVARAEAAATVTLPVGLWDGADTGFFGQAILTGAAGAGPTQAQDELIRVFTMPGVLNF